MITMHHLLTLALGLLLLPDGAHAFPSYPTDSDRPTGTLRGMVLDEATLEPLAGVHVLLEALQTGTVTGTDGRFSMDRLPAGVYTVRFQYLGFESRVLTDVVVASNRSVHLDVRMAETYLQGQEVTVTAGFFRRDAAQPVSRVTFNPEELRRSPGSGQELSRVLAALPGVASGGDVSQDIMVRGGSPNENGFYIDGIRMPGVAHFSLPGGSSNGPIGLVNTDLIGEVTFSAGGFGPSFGPFASSITDITYREGDRTRHQGDILFSMGGLGVLAEGGIHDGRGSYLISARRSYLDLIAGAIGAGGAPRYSDFQSKTVHDFHPRHRAGTLIVAGRSRFDSSADDAQDQGLSELFQTGNEQITLGATHRYIWWGRGFTESAISLSLKHDDVRGERVSDAALTERFDIQHRFTAFRSVSRWHPGHSLTVEFGGDATLEDHRYDFFIRGGTSAQGTVSPDFERDTEIGGLLGGLFSSVTFRMLPSWIVTVGGRADYNGYSSQWDITPRLATSLQLTPRLDASIAYGRYIQPNTRYLMAQYAENRSLQTMRATHWVAALGYQPAADTRITLEVYHKGYDRIPEVDLSRLSTIPLPEYVPDNFVSTFGGLRSTGVGQAYGVDILLQKKLARNWYGMASASLFRSEYRGYNEVWYSRNFDTRSLFNVIGGYRPNPRHEFSLRWSYQGGRPYTPYDLEASRQAGSGIVDASRFNGERMPAYHSLYLRADRRYFFRHTSLVTFVEVWNAYNRSNIAGYYWSRTHQEVRSWNQFTFLPIGGMKFTF